MRLLTLLTLFNITLSGQNLSNILHYIDSSPALNSADMLIEASKQMSLAKEGLNIPSIDIDFKASHLEDTPIMILHFPDLSEPSLDMPMAKRDNFEGEISISYPIFTGFAISAQIDKSRLELQRTKLKRDDLKRNLYLRATQIFMEIKITQAYIKAQFKAKKAMKRALKKAKGLFKQGLIAPSELYSIKSKLYEIDSIIAKSYSNRDKLLNTLSYLTDREIKRVSGNILINIPSSKELKLLAHQNRADILALRKLLDINDAEIKLARSSLYPKVALKAGLKRKGDTLKLNGDGYTNGNKSYIAIDINYNLYSGGKDIHTIESARYIKLANQSKLIDYIHQVDMQIDNAYSDLKALRYRLKSAKMQVKAQREYYRLTLGRFENQMASGDELSRAIASLADATAQKEAIIYSIKLLKAKIKLLGGLTL